MSKRYYFSESLRFQLLYACSLFLFQAFSGISDSKLITPGKIPKLSFNCGLENIILSENVFTSNLNWIEELTFEGCYIQDGHCFYSFILLRIGSYVKKSLRCVQVFNSGNCQTFHHTCIEKGIVGSIQFLLLRTDVDLNYVYVI